MAVNKSLLFRRGGQEVKDFLGEHPPIPLIHLHISALIACQQMTRFLGGKPNSTD